MRFCRKGVQCRECDGLRRRGLAAEPHDIASAVRQFRPQEHRLEYVDTIRDAVLQRLKGYQRGYVSRRSRLFMSLLLIAGGRARTLIFRAGLQRRRK